MSQVLYLVCDTSGSMSEGSKFLQLRGVVRAVEQYARLGCATLQIRLVVWNETPALAEWNPDDEVPDSVLQCGGSASVTRLRELLSNQHEGKMLLLTDGFWSQDEGRELKHWKKAVPPDTFRFIRIGTDADPLLKGDDVFKADDLFAAFDGWFPAPAQTVEEDEW